MPKASERLPQIKHPYQNHSMDNLRWNFFTPRADDIVVATSYKAGTTWVQAIVGNLIFTGQRLPGSIDEMSPWLDNRLFPLELVLTALQRQTHRRSIKTHLPLDSLPYDRRIKYLYVGRDPRDVFMSFWNFYGNFPRKCSTHSNAYPDGLAMKCQDAPTIFTSFGAAG